MHTTRATRTEFLSCAQTASLLRPALKAAFPTITFSVKSKTYSGGASITVSWTDGPTSSQVEAVSGRFSGATFDGMIDLKSYHPSTLNGRKVHFGADYVFTRRFLSVAFVTPIAARVAAEYGKPTPVVSAGRYSGEAYIDRDAEGPLFPDSGHYETLGDYIMRACWATPA